MKKYWLYAEPYLAVSKNNKKIVLTNTLTGESVIYPNNTDIDNLVNELLKKENMYCIELNEDNFKNQNINNFLIFLREKFLANWLNKEAHQKKPIIMPPVLNLQKEVNRLIDNDSYSLGDNITDNLTELNFYINSENEIGNDNEPYHQFLAPVEINLNTGEITFDMIKDILRQVQSSDISVINILSNNLFNHSVINNIIKVFDSLSMKKHYHIQAGFIDIYREKLVKLNGENNTLNVHVINTEDYNSVKKSLSVLKNYNIRHKFVFAVTSEADYQNVVRISKENNIETYELKPLYTGRNISFFEENIYLTEEDILSSDIKKKDYFMSQVLNSNEFGKLTFFSNGDVYANNNHPKLGNIKTDSMFDLLIKEMTEGTSWRMIRDKKPCNHCIFQRLCPSPSNYELVIGINDLCTVNLEYYEHKTEYRQETSKA